MATYASRAESRNSEVIKVERIGKNNIEWLRPHLKNDRVGILLVGGTSVVDFRLRTAQSHLRSDLTPSHFSHAALLGNTDSQKPEATPLYEISLMPQDGFDFPTPTNGVQKSV